MKSSLIPSSFRTLATTAACVMLGAGLGATPVYADEAPPSIHVKYGDLDITQREGATVLFERIRGEAHQVCAPLDRSAPSMQMKYRSCVDDAVARAVTSVNEPALASVYGAKTGKSLSGLASK